MMAGVWQDFQYALRTWRRTPVFSVAAVLLLATGIGLSATAFSLVRAYLVTPLPYPDADRVVQLIADASRSFANTPRGLERIDVQGLRDVFTETAAWDLDGFTVVGGEQPEFVDGAWVNPGFFAIVGARPHLGRLLDDADVRGNTRAIVISHAYWQRRFGGRADIVNQTIRAFSTDRPLGADLFTIVGVLPPEFWHVNTFTDILAPLPGPRLPSLARLAPGVRLEEAISRLNGAARAAIPDASPDWRMTLVPVQQEYALRIRPTILILFAAVGCVLLVASANVAGLLVVRGVARRHELSVRAALGAGRGRLVRQLLIESLALALAAGAAGLWLTFISADVLAVWIESQLGVAVPGGAAGVRLDPIVAAFAILTTIIVGLLTGLRPAFSGSDPDCGYVIGSGSRGGNPAGRGRFRTVMVVSQVALSFVLLAGAGLMVRTLIALQNTDLGFAPEGVLKAHVLLPQARYPNAPARVAAIDRVLDRVGAIPGVQAVATVMPHPFRFQVGQLLDAELANADGILAAHHVVAGDYWRTMGIRVMEGRVFDGADRAGAERVAIISATLAQRLWPGQSALGRRLRTSTAPQAPWRTIVGVVNDVRKTYTEALVGDTYVPYAQEPGGYFALMVRGGDDPAQLTQPVQRGLATIAPDLPMHEVEPMTLVVERQGRQRRFLAILLGGFAALTAGIALIGLYTVLSFTVTMRTREIAVRVAVGASQRQIRASVIREGAVLVASGIGAGLALSLLLSRAIAAQLYGVSEFDVLSYAVAGFAFGLVSIAAVYAPAMRAARVDPIAALRAE